MHRRDPVGDSAPAARVLERFGVGALRAALALGLAVATLNAALATGRSPAVLAATVAWAAAWASALALAPRVRAVLARRPLLVPALVVVGTLPVVLDGGLGSVAISGPVALVWVAAVTAGPGTTLLTGLTVAVAFVASLVLAGTPVAGLVGPELRYDVVTNAFNGPFAAGAALVLVGTFRSLLLTTPRVLRELRTGGPASSPGLQRLIAAPDAAPHALPAADDAALLTDAERAVVRLLAAGLVPKEIARERGVALATVRTQIKRAKRKTGARTLGELAARVGR